MIGQEIGQYRVIEQIGRGGMATVYKAYQTSMDRYVALKVLPRHFMHDPTFLGRFEREARTIAKLGHIHILPVHDYGEHEGIPYLVMHHVGGGSLSRLLKEHSEGLPLDEAARLIGQIASALDYAHARGVIHRDIKPSNVLLDDERNALLTDFGIAKVAEATVQFTGQGTVGTPTYMSPEQGQGLELTPATDVYSLGVVLYEMLTGRVPFEATTPIAVIHAHIYDPLPSPRDFRADLPEAVERVLLKALTKAPEDRYQTAGEMAAALYEAVQTAPVASPAETQVAQPEEVEPTVLEEPTPPSAPTPPAPPVVEPTVPAAEEPRPLDEVGPTVLDEPMPSPVQMPPAVPPVPEPSPMPARKPSRPPAGLLTVGLAIVAALFVVGVVVVLILPGIRPASTGGSDEALRLTSDPAADLGPAYAPLSGNLAFASDRDGDFEIYVLDADGGVTQLTFNNADDVRPVYAPSGGNLAFASDRDGDFEIYVLNASGEVQQLTFNDVEDLYPAYDPTGGNLAFASDRDGDFEIYVLDAAGGVTQLTFNNADDIQPCYAPLSGNLAFASDRDGDFEIYALDAAGNVTQMTQNNSDDIRPAYAPAGGTLAFASNRNGNYEIFVLNSDGDVMQLTFNDADDLYPAYDPTGSNLAFASDRNGDFEIYVLGPSD